MTAARRIAPCREPPTVVRQRTPASERAARPTAARARRVPAEPVWAGAVVPPEQRVEAIQTVGATALPGARAAATRQQKARPAQGAWRGESTRRHATRTADQWRAASPTRSIVAARSRRTAGSGFTKPTAAETPARSGSTTPTAGGSTCSSRVAGRAIRRADAPRAPREPIAAKRRPTPRPFVSRASPPAPNEPAERT